MRNTRVLNFALAALVLTGAGGVMSDPSRADQALTGSALERTVSGRKILLATPLGGEFPLNYHADGRVDGQGEAAGLGRFMRPNDSGRWWVDGGKLCQQWKTWYDGKVFCFTLQKLAADQLAWRRDDGLEGRARIAR